MSPASVARLVRSLRPVRVLSALALFLSGVLVGGCSSQDSRPAEMRPPQGQKTQGQNSQERDEPSHGEQDRPDNPPIQAENGRPGENLVQPTTPHFTSESWGELTRWMLHQCEEAAKTDDNQFAEKLLLDRANEKLATIQGAKVAWTVPIDSVMIGPANSDPVLLSIPSINTPLVGTLPYYEINTRPHNAPHFRVPQAAWVADIRGANRRARVEATVKNARLYRVYQGPRKHYVGVIDLADWTFSPAKP